MPLKLTIKVGSDQIDAEGDFAIDENVVKLTAEWIKALPPQDQREAERLAQAQIDTVAGRMRTSQDALETAVVSHGGFGNS